MRLIDADELKKALAEMWYESAISITGVSISELIDNTPTIEPIDDTKSCGVSADKSADQNVENVPSADEYVPNKSCFACMERANGLCKGTTQEQSWCPIITKTKIETDCETCRHNDEWYSVVGCGGCCDSNSHYEPSDLINRPNKYNLELIADIVRQLGHLDNYIADTYLRPNNKIHIQFENIFSDDCYFIEDDKYILAELEKIATDTEDCVEFTLTNNKKVIIHAADKPKGEWKTNNTYEDLIFCSECGMSFEDNLLPRNYCPCCGADMRGERNE